MIGAYVFAEWQIILLMLGDFRIVGCIVGRIGEQRTYRGVHILFRALCVRFLLLLHPQPQEPSAQVPPIFDYSKPKSYTIQSSSLSIQRQPKSHLG